MILKRLVVPGHFVEAHLYFDFLWLIDAGGSVRALDLATFIDARLNGEGAAAHRLFARNDQLVTDRFSARASEQRPDVQRLLQSDKPITLSEKDVEEFSFHFGAEEDLEQPLDVRFYSGRAYVGAPGGLFQFMAPGRDDLSGSTRRGAASRPLRLKRVFDEGTPRQIQCRFGSVNFACGPEGGFVGLGALTADDGWEPKARKIVATSFFTEVNRAGIGHVGEAAELQLAGTRMSSSLGPVPRDDQAERLEVTDVEAKDDEAMDRAKRALRSNTGSDVTPERMYLTTAQALVVMSDGSLRMFAYAKDAEFLHTKAHITALKPPPGRILATTTTCGKIVAECDDDIFVLNRSSGRWTWQKIFGEPVYSVRGYPASKWYRQMLTIVAEGRTELVFIGED